MENEDSINNELINPELYNNIGVLSLQLQDFQNSEKYLDLALKQC